MRHIKQNRRVLYTNLMTNGKLNRYLTDIDRQAEDMFSRLINELAKKEGITETLKAIDQMLWVRKMNIIRSRATEIVNHYIIYN